MDAIARLAPTRPRLRLVLAGDGDLRGEFERRISAHGIGDRVRLPGVLLQDDVAAALAAADVVAVPSVKDPSGNVDGLPNMVLEALASSTPLVASAVGGIPKVVTDGVTAELVPPGDVSALARAIQALLENPSRRASLGAAARREAVAERSWERVAERFEAAYERAARFSS